MGQRGHCRVMKEFSNIGTLVIKQFKKKLETEKKNDTNNKHNLKKRLLGFDFF